MNTYLGIDLGGTNVRVAKVDELGNIIQQVKGPSYGQEGPRKVIDNIIAMIKQIDNYSECLGVGIGVPGPVNTEEQVMSMSTNLQGFTGYPMAKEISEAINMPVYLDNDANVAGLAESLVGAGKGKNVVYYVTISTGIGGALVANGKLVSGRRGYAGEVANIVIDRNREKINHLNVGAVENEASGTALVRKARSIITDKEIRHAGDVFALASEKDERALKLVDEMTTDLAYMFSIIAHICDPHMFVLGGGVMKSADAFLPQVIEKFKGLVHEQMKDIPFVKAELEEPGVIGAAMLPVSMRG